MGHTTTTYGEVSLDDLELVDGICPPPLTCSFDDETENCRWDNCFTCGATLPWDLGSGSENVSSGPLYVLLPFYYNNLLNVTIIFREYMFMN